MSTFWTTAELLQRGKSPRDIRRAVDTAVMREVRKGQFAGPSAATDVVRAVRVGGVATATTATRALGIWTPPDVVPGFQVIRRGPREQRLHIAVAKNASPAPNGRGSPPSSSPSGMRSCRCRPSGRWR